MSDQKQPNITIDRGAALKDVDISTHNNNNTVIYQGGAAEDKRKEENRAFFKDFACRLIEKGIITDDIRTCCDGVAVQNNSSGRRGEFDLLTARGGIYKGFIVTAL